MYKLTTFDPILPDGSLSLVKAPEFKFYAAKNAPLIKVASDSKVYPQAIQDFLSNLKRLEGSLYYLCNAMGSGERWGANKNGDYWPEADLSHPGNDYGYETFMRYAKPFRGHKNTDPSKGYGDIPFSWFDKNVSRVYLVMRIDSNLPHFHEIEDIIDAIEKGEPVATSMGAKVPFDQCLVSHSLIRTYDGYKPIGSIGLGDLVRTHTGQMKPVRKILKRISEEGVIVIKPSGVPDVLVTREHPFLVLKKDDVRACNGSANGVRTRHVPLKNTPYCKRCGREILWQLQWVCAKDINAGDFLVSPVDAQQSEETVGANRARLLGYYIGDGHVNKARRGRKRKGSYRDMGFSFTLSIDEKIHLQKILDTLSLSNIKNKPRVYEDKKKHCYTVVVSDQDAAAWLIKYGGRGSRGKRLHERVFSWSDSEKLNLLGGYIDTDGSYDHKSASVRISTVNRGLALDIQRVCHSLNMPVSVFYGGLSYGYTPNGVVCWYIYFSPSCCINMCEYSAKIPFLDKKVCASSKSFFWDNYWCTPVIDIFEDNNQVEVCNISVLDDESYIAEGIAVHNCSICGNKAKTRANYCSHASTQMGKILPDGRQVYVENPRPKFFDNSFVRRGAEPSAFILSKLAGDRSSRSSIVVPSVELAEGHYDLRKVAFLIDEEDAKVAQEEKVSDITKRIPAEIVSLNGDEDQAAKDMFEPFVERHADELRGREKKLSNEILEKLSNVGIDKVASTLRFLGVELRPDEFQKCVLMNRGERELADQFEQNGILFGKDAALISPDQAYKVSLDNMDLDLAKDLVFNTDILEKRSSFRPYLLNRTIELVKSAQAGDIPQSYPQTSIPRQSPLAILAAIGGIYFALKKMPFDIAREGAYALETVVQNNPWIIPFGLYGAPEMPNIYNEFVGEREIPVIDRDLGVPFSKTSSVAEVVAKSPKKWLSIHNPALRFAVGLPAAYLMAGHEDMEEAQGNTPGLLGRMVQKHPAAMGIGFGLFGGEAWNGLKNVGKKLVKTPMQTVGGGLDVASKLAEDLSTLEFIKESGACGWANPIEVDSIIIESLNDVFSKR